MSVEFVVQALTLYCLHTNWNFLKSSSHTRGLYEQLITIVVTICFIINKQSRKGENSNGTTVWKTDKTSVWACRIEEEKSVS